MAANVLRRLEREHWFRPADGLLRELLDEMLANPDMASQRRHPSLPAGAHLVGTFHVDTLAGDELQMMTTIGTVGAPYDVTLDELRLETFFPTDAATVAALAGWAVDCWIHRVSE